MCRNLNIWNVLDEADCRRKVASGKRAADAIRVLVNARGFAI